MMCYNGTKYMLYAMPYIGRATNTNGLHQGEYYVKELSRPIHGTNRNITCDNCEISSFGTIQTNPCRHSMVQ